MVGLKRVLRLPKNFTFGLKRRELRQTLALSDSSCALMSVLHKNSSYSVSKYFLCDDMGDIVPYSPQFFDAVFDRLTTELLKNRKIRVVLPFNEVFVKTVEMDVQPEDAEAAFAYRFEEFFPFDKDEYIFDLAEIGFNSAGKRQYSAAALNRHFMENMARSVAKHNIDVEFAEPAQSALERAMAFVASSVFERTLCIYAGENFSEMVLMQNGNGIYSGVLQGISADEICGSYDFALTKVGNFTADCLCIFGSNGERVDGENIRTALGIEFASRVNAFESIEGECPVNDIFCCALGAALR